MRVSVALCTYNGEAHLREQLESLLAQDHLDIELVAADDASTDGTWQILEAYAPRFAAARLIRNSRNLGLRANFEQAFRACSGEWIAPCDQDDVWLPQKLNRLLAEAEAGPVLIYCDSALIDAHGRPSGGKVSDRYHMASGTDPLAFALMNCVSGHASIFRRSLLERALPIPEGANYDWWLAFVAAQSGGIAYVDEPLVRFRQHEANASGFAGQLKRGAPRSASERNSLEARNLASLAAFSGPGQAFFRRLASLWALRVQHRFTPRLAWLLVRHRHSVFAMKRSSPAAKWRHALKYLWSPR